MSAPLHQLQTEDVSEERDGLLDVFAANRNVPNLGHTPEPPYPCERSSVQTSTTAKPPPRATSTARRTAGPISAASLIGPSPCRPKVRAIAAKSTSGSSMRMATRLFSGGRP